MIQSYKKTELDWENGVLNIRTDANGVSKEVRIEFDNNDLAKLLTIPHVNEPLTDRLKTAFFSEEEQQQQQQEKQQEKQDTSFSLIPLKIITHFVPERRHTKKYKTKPKRVKSKRRRQV